MRYGRNHWSFRQKRGGIDTCMRGTQVSGIPSLKREEGGERHHLLQATAKEIRHK